MRNVFTRIVLAAFIVGGALAATGCLQRFPDHTVRDCKVVSISNGVMTTGCSDPVGTW